MSALKATPGPWRFNAPDTIVSNQSHPVARLTEPHNRVLSGGAIGNDGPLIAAAPDLYAALGILVAEERHFCSQCGRVLTERACGPTHAARAAWWDAARAAIAKARGES